MEGIVEVMDEVEGTVKVMDEVGVLQRLWMAVGGLGYCRLGGMCRLWGYCIMGKCASCTYDRFSENFIRAQVNWFSFICCLSFHDTQENPVGAAVTPSCKVLLGHASELVSVLKMPTIAIQVLSPTPYKEKGSDEQQARTTRILQSVVRLAQTNIEQLNLPGGPSSTVPGGPSSTLPGGPSM